MFDGKNCYLYLNHSTISYNYAYNDGGGVYVGEDSERCTIEMVSSHIDHNVADDNGAGIYVGAEYFRLIGDAEQVMEPENVSDWEDKSLGSSVSNNYLVDSDWYAGGGAGIHLWEDHAIVSGINFVGNYADGNWDEGGDGGGIFMREENITIRSCNIINNKANVLGGGVENYNDKNTIDSCTIYGNRVTSDRGAGGGVYTEFTNDLTLAGTTIIRGNSSKSYEKDNMFLPGLGTYATNAFIIPALENGADVHIRTANSHQDRVSTFGAFRDEWFAYDNDSSHYIGWSRKDRCLKVTAGVKPVTPTETFEPDDGKTTKIVEGGYTVDGENYTLLKGVAEMVANANAETDETTVFYYSDGYFMGDTTEYNQHLATMTAVLNCATGFSNDGGFGSDPEIYVDKSNNFRQLMSDIGVKDEDIYVNDYYTTKPQSFSIGVGIASKKTESGDTLVIVSVRSMNYEQEWVSNVTLGKSGEAYGFGDAASKVYAELIAYMDRKGIDGSDKHTKFWITGYSRGGATANLTAKRVVDYFDPEGRRVYAYPIAPPKGGLESEKIDENNYGCIHNTLNQNDIVPFVGPEQMGFIRYGVDHYIPGSLTEEAANTPFDVGSDEYEANLETMLAHLAAVSPVTVFDDYFHPATINYVTGAAFSNFGVQMVDETDGRSNWTPETFIPLFIKKLQQYALNYAENNNYRAAYSSKTVANNRTFEQAVAVVVKLVFAKSADEVEGITECFGSLIDRLDMSDLALMYMAIHKYDSLIPIDPDIISNIIGSAIWNSTRSLIWQKLTVLSHDDEAAGFHAIGEYLTAEELKELENCFDALLLPVIELLTLDYKNYDQDILGTLAYNVGNILINHYQEVMLSWLRTFDDFYADDKAIVRQKPEVKTAPSEVALKIVHEDTVQEIMTDDSVVYSVTPGDKVSFVPADDSAVNTGEAVYFRYASGEDWNRQWYASCTPLEIGDMVPAHAADDKIIIDTFAAHYSQFSNRKQFILAVDGNADVSKETLISVDDIAVTVPHGSTESDILAALPEFVYATKENGLPAAVGVNWTLKGPVLSTDDAQIVHAVGTLVTEQYETGELTASATVTVLAADKPAAPYASVESGSYTGAITVALRAEEGSVIRYALPETVTAENGEYIYPDLDHAEFTEYTEPILLNRYNETLYLAAYAVRDGRESGRITYTYKLTEPEVVPMEGKAASIAEDGNIVCWYSTKEEQIGCDENGEPVYEQVPDQYYADEACTMLLEYNEDVVIPAFISTWHTAADGDDVADLWSASEGFGGQYRGFDTIGVQEIGDDGRKARILTVLDPRIISDATDYGYLFAENDNALTIDSAQFVYSCKNTDNNLLTVTTENDPGYRYVTAQIANGFLDPDMKACFYVKLEDNETYIYTDAVRCTATIDNSAGTDAAMDNIRAGAEMSETVTYNGVTGSFNDKIKLNFYFDIPEELLADEGAKVILTNVVTGKPIEIPISKATEGTGEGLKFSIPLAAKEASDTIIAKIYDGQDKAVSIVGKSKTDYTETGVQCSLMTYFDWLKNSGETDDEKNLGAAAKDYCTVAQIYFNYHADGLTVSEDLNEVTAEALSDYAPQVSGTRPEGVSVRGITAMLEADNTLRLYLKFDDINPETLTYEIDGTEVDLKQRSTDGAYYLALDTGVYSNDLHTRHTYTISDGTDANPYTVTASVLSYAWSCMEYGSKEIDKSLAGALYLYNRKAIDAFGNKSASK